jgi:hypothetical protein
MDEVSSKINDFSELYTIVRALWNLITLLCGFLNRYMFLVVVAWWF